MSIKRYSIQSDEHGKYLRLDQEGSLMAHTDHQAELQHIRGMLEAIVNEWRDIIEKDKEPDIATLVLRACANDLESIIGSIK